MDDLINNDNNKNYKKIIAWTIVVGLLLVLVLLWFFYKPSVTEMTPAKDNEKQNENSVLLVCVDKCGDGVCQEVATDCKEGNLNCACLENITDCPQDCLGK